MTDLRHEALHPRPPDFGCLDISLHREGGVLSGGSREPLGGFLTPKELCSGHRNITPPGVRWSVSGLKILGFHKSVRTRVILKVFSVMFSTLLRSGFVLVRQSIVLCSQERFEP